MLEGTLGLSLLKVLRYWMEDLQILGTTEIFSG
jgi:hypothetical protein